MEARAVLGLHVVDVEAGLALEVVPDEELMAHVHTQAAKLGALPLSSLMTTKRLLMDPLRDAMKAAMHAENAGLDELTGSPANKEAMRAFMDKREADFTGM